MCTRCGCGDPDIVRVELKESLLADNDARAAHNRQHFEAAGMFALNLMGSPGSGKTALLEATARLLPEHGLFAFSADLATERDAERLAAAGIPSRAITTGQACHLDAAMVHHAMHEMPAQGVDFLFIENVGNLVCPAIYDLGEHARVLTLSVTEGEDKPLKYPVMFKAVELLVLTKCDLLPHLEVDLAKIEHALACVMPEPRLIKLSAKTGEGLEAWRDWLLEKASTSAQ